MSDTTDTLNVIAETSLKLKALKAARDQSVKYRDACAWSLHIHDHWTHTAILADFGTASHDAWTKSRKRMDRQYPDTAPPRVDNAADRLKDAVAALKDIDAQRAALEATRIQAVHKAVAEGASQSTIAAAAEVSRQAISTMLKRQKAAA